MIVQRSGTDGRTDSRRRTYLNGKGSAHTPICRTILPWSVNKRRRRQLVHRQQHSLVPIAVSFPSPFPALAVVAGSKKTGFFLFRRLCLCVCAVGSGYGTTDHHCTFELEKERENMGGKGRSSSSSSSSERKSHDKGKRVSQSKQTVFSQSSLQRRPIFFSRTSFDFYGGRTRCPMSKLIDCSRCTPFLCTADILSFISIL